MKNFIDFRFYLEKENLIIKKLSKINFKIEVKWWKVIKRII